MFQDLLTGLSPQATQFAGGNPLLKAEIRSTPPRSAWSGLPLRVSAYRSADILIHVENALDTVKGDVGTYRSRPVRRRRIIARMPVAAAPLGFTGFHA